MKESLKVVVRRREWLRGVMGELNTSYLYRPSDEKMCCLGFACEAAGIKREDMSRVMTPRLLQRNMGKALPSSLSGLVNGVVLEGYNTPVASKLMDLNDALMQGIDDPNREEKIREKGKEIGIEFTFVD